MNKRGKWYVSEYNYLLYQSASDPLKKYRFFSIQVLASTGTLTSYSEAEYNYLMEPTNGDPILEVFQTSVALKDLKFALDSVNPFDLPACQALLKKCQETQQKLIGLSKQGSLGMDTPENGSKFTDETCIASTDPIFGSAYRFSSLDNAMLFAMISAHLAILWPLTYRAHSFVNSQTMSPVELIHSQSRFWDMEVTTPEAYADKMARALPYCFQKGTKMACARYSMYCLSVASFVNYATGNRAKHMWCQGVLRYMSDHGFDIASYLMDQASTLWTLKWDAGSAESTFQGNESYIHDGYMDYSDYSTLIRGV